MIHCNLLVNGFEVHATFSEQAVSNIFEPLLHKLTSLQRLKGSRLVVCLAAPPAAGKSTLAAYLEMLSTDCEDAEPLQALGIDGFHFHQDYILSHTVLRAGTQISMKDVKGCPESYNVKKLLEAVRTLKTGDIKWPFYGRRLHDVVEDAVEVNRDIVLLEGNWLLLDEGDWPELRGLCDYSIMLSADESVLKSRLIERKMRGGLSAQQAADFYESSDGPNIARCLEGSTGANLTLRLDA
jgi:putative kinase